MLKRIYPKIQKQGQRLYVYIQEYKDGKHKRELLKIDESVIVEGGPSTGKTSFLLKAQKKLEEEGGKVIFINATLPIGDWVKEYKLFGKNLEARMDYFLKGLPEKFYLLIDNAERLQDSRKLEFTLALLERARSTIIGCTRFNLLNPKLKVRLNDAKIHSLGAGADTFDITFFAIAILIVVVALLGAHNLIFLAAALRYIFQGTKMGGKV